jgi:WD40 repeat protein
LSPDDQRLAVGNRAFIEVWNLRTGKAIGEQFIGHRGDIYEMVFLLDGASVVTGGADGNVRVWDATSGRHLRVLAHGQKCVTGLDISPDGKRIASTHIDTTVLVWDIEQFRLQN